MTAAARFGILGGTFDPVHVGHVGAALAARDALGLTRVVLMPNHVPPHRPRQPTASPYHRFAMSALAVQGLDGLEVSDMELEAAGPTFTADTLKRLHAAGLRAPQIFFITGADAFAEIRTWHRYPDVLDMAAFVVVSRPGLAATALPPLLPELAARMSVPGALPRAGSPLPIYLVDSPTPAISSSDIRRRLAERLPVTGLVPAPVEEHIRRHRLYVDETPSTAAITAADHLHGQD